MSNENEKWDTRFLELATLIASWSKDPSTQVGCVMVGPYDREIRSTGYNGFPRGVPDDDRLNNRDVKYDLIVHAEENAILNATLTGVSLKGCSAYVTWPPCTRCARMLVQVGVREIVSKKDLSIPERWQSDFDKAKALLTEVAVVWRLA